MHVNNQKSFLITLVTLCIFYMIWFLWLFATDTHEGPANFYSNTYGIIPLLGGIYGLLLAPRWGGLKSAIGKAVTFLSLGLITWGTGMAIWLYYNIVLGVAVPYPSFADAAFILSWPLWGIGAANLSIATGAKFALKNVTGRVILFLIPIAIVLFSYYFLIVIARQGIISSFEDGLKTFFDLAYPIGDIVILTLAFLIIGLSYRYFGGLYKMAIYFVLGGFIANYFADFTFSYTTSLGTYYNGSLADALFVMTMTLLCVGIALLDPRRISNQKTEV